MAIPTVDISYLGVLIAAVVGMVIGGFWYSPILFGKVWMKLSGITPKQITEAKKKGMMGSYLINFIALFVTAIILALFAAYIGLTSVLDGLYLGLLVWIGFIVTSMLAGLLWEGKSLKLYLLNVFHYFVVLIVMSIIVSVWH